MDLVCILMFAMHSYQIKVALTQCVYGGKQVMQHDYSPNCSFHLVVNASKEVDINDETA